MGRDKRGKNLEAEKGRQRRNLDEERGAISSEEASFFTVGRRARSCDSNEPRSLHLINFIMKVRADAIPVYVYTDFLKEAKQTRETALDFSSLYVCARDSVPFFSAPSSARCFGARPALFFFSPPRTHASSESLL